MPKFFQIIQFVNDALTGPAVATMKNSVGVKTAAKMTVPSRRGKPIAAPGLDTPFVGKRRCPLAFARGVGRRCGSVPGKFDTPDCVFCP